MKTDSVSEGNTTFEEDTCREGNADEMWISSVYQRYFFARFAGRDLTNSKEFRKTDDLKIPTRALEPMRSGIERDLPEVGVRHFYPRNFNATTRSKEEEEKLVKERKVVLRDVNITHDLVLGKFETRSENDKAMN